MTALTEGNHMPPTLGGSQSVTQAVVVPQTTFDSNKAPMKVALFKPDGTPFLADTATVYSVMAAFSQELNPAAYAALMSGVVPGTYGARLMIFKQTDHAQNGIFQFMTGAPGTTGTQPLKKLSDLPIGDAVIGSVVMLGDPHGEGTIDADNYAEIAAIAKDGGFLFGAVSVGEVAGVPQYIWGCIYDSSRLAAIEARITALEA